MDEKTIQRIKKLQALAERGVGGEKTTAQKKLAKLLKDNGINSLDELQKEEYEYTIFSYNGKHEIKLLRQCMYKVITEGMDREIHTANMLGITVIDANQIKRHLEYEEKRQERAASDYAKLHSCEFCKGSKLYSCTGYDCREPYRQAYDYALSRIRERQET